MKIKKIALLSFFLITSLSFGQDIKKDVVESGGVENNITATKSGMYDGTKSKEAQVFFDKAFDYAEKQDFKNSEKYYLKAIAKDTDFV